MTVANAKSGSAMQQVLDNLKDLPTSSLAKDIDLIFLRGIMESRVVRSLAKAHERLEEVKLEAVRDDNIQLISDILDSLNKLSVKDAATVELTRILQGPHFMSLIEAHDQVAAKSYEMPNAAVNCTATLASCLVPADAIRMIGIQKKAGEPLGVTFRVEQGEMVVARILHDSSIDRQGMLHTGDIIREVNGHQVGGDPHQLQELLRDCSGSVTLKVLPSYKDSPTLPQVYLKSHFNYNPASDNLIPCREAGLAFSKGDILHVVNKDDPNWWQARSVVGGATGLIPSQFLEEKRKAFVRKEGHLSAKGMLCGSLMGKKKKKKKMYLMAKNAEFDRYELQIYEEVAKMPPFQRKTLVLIGAQGVGRRSLKNRLIVLNPLRYGTTVPFTSRSPREEERDGQNYSFVTRHQMEQDIKDSRFLEHGEYDGNLYGTKIDSIHQVVAAGRTCILDVNPQALKVLKTAEFMPFVVFIAAPELDTLRNMHKAVVDAGLTTKLLTESDLKKTVEESAKIRRAYSHFFDLVIYNDNLDKAFDQLQEAVERLLVEPQWVPVSWVY
ncbi:MAGUK p55 subfamily member 6a isoform X1 [Syngnathus scovelli]|uniref:MAGUK p55 subfamily member 6a isoform X1 n=2 Tax=Syngnathus scovelli TaxID=161590 RepID=UPI0021102D75|nr:MAGUK p55 subfamily member 6a isoform X1 [Syngnathus scovelli]XP_049586171.1 MAGUK p55 subfamily member 6a isoform X1 [Syngnathus scovelli]